MKKTIFLLFLLCAALGLFAQSGTIRELYGKVELKAPGSSFYVPARAGDRISQSTIISTGFKSNALIEVGSSLLTVRPLTRLTLTEIRSATGTETLNVNLQAGRVRVDVNPPAGTRAAMSVRSPVATASVRGTSFEFDTRNLLVREGTVSYQGSRGTVMMVSAGSSGKLNESGKAEDPVEVRIADIVPPPPVGVDTSLGSANNPSASGAAISIDFEYTP